MTMQDMANYGGGSMTKAGVPLRWGDTNTTEHLWGGWHIKGVETMVTPTSKKNDPGCSVFNQEMRRMKFNKNIVVTSEFLNG